MILILITAEAKRPFLLLTFLESVCASGKGVPPAESGFEKRSDALKVSEATHAGKRTFFA